MSKIADDILIHYGVGKMDGAPGRGSGRYELGSGDAPYQHGSGGFTAYVKGLRDEGFTYKDPETGDVYTGDKAIAAFLGLTTTQFRAEYSLAKDQERQALVATAEALKDKGYSVSEIARQMGYANESSVRALLNESAKARMNVATETADYIKSQVDKKGLIDVGIGVEKEIGSGISREKLEEALYLLQKQGYKVYDGSVPQATNPGKETHLRVIGPPGTEWKDIYDYGNINSLTDYTSHDQGQTFDPTWVYPKSMDSSRMTVAYSSPKDGLIEIRPGVEDLSLGDSHYAQVRILVDGTHYLKGMAIYSDDLPDGVDIRFNTGKPEGTPIKKGDTGDGVLKKIGDDPDNPFGSLIKAGVNDPNNPASDDFRGGQSYYYDKNGKKQLSLINKRAEEGDWSEWSNKLPAQFLSKQGLPLIQKQLSLGVADKQAELNEIKTCTNPTVKKQLLKSFADSCDSTAMHLYAAALPRQQYQTLLPLNSIGDNEVYAPNYKQGETVALVRFPHAGTFEIPICKVNNNNPEGQKVIGGNTKDAIGINQTVAHRLSGADFDGDTVMVIPCNSNRSSVRINSTSELEGLKDFDPTMKYGGKEPGTFKVLSKGATQAEMGRISNLITDMTIKGATPDELARAVRHSMVVIDANKHELDYKQSEKDNDIAGLKRKYQLSIDDSGNEHAGGASTILSRSKSEESITKRVGSPKIDKDTGEVSYYQPEKEYTDKNGKTKIRQERVTKMEATNDAYTLVSEARAPQELAYANYANSMKSMGNEARKIMVNTKDIQYDANAKKIYSKEVQQLDAKLSIAEKNAPRERYAQCIANANINAKKKDHPEWTKAEIKKTKQQELTSARASVGAKRQPIKIEDKEWEAIQAGAISPNKLTRILRHTDIEDVKERAIPRKSNTISDAKIARIKGMKASGYNNAEIAAMLGISTSTVSKYLK